MTLLSSSLPLLIFYLLNRFTSDRWVLMYPTVIVYSSISFCNSISLHCLIIYHQVHTQQEFLCLLGESLLYRYVMHSLVSANFPCLDVWTVQLIQLLLHSLNQGQHGVFFSIQLLLVYMHLFINGRFPSANIWLSLVF